MLVVIVGFPLFGPPRKNGRYSFHVFSCFLDENPFFNPPGKDVFDFFTKTMGNHQKNEIIFCLPSGRKTFADAGDGDGGEPFRTI